jgi:hypothetical protein
MDLLRPWWARAFLALLILGQALNMLFATALTAAYRLQYLRVAEFLGGFTPGDDYHRFIPLMEATPWWLHGLWVAAAVLFFASAWQLLRNRPSAFLLFAVAWLLGTASDLISRALPAYRQVFSFPEPLFTRAVLIPAATMIIPVLIGAALWAHSRRSLAGERAHV